MYFPIMGRNLFCWLLGWGLGVGGCVCMRDSCSEGCFLGEEGKEKEWKKKKKKNSLVRMKTSPRSNIQPFQFLLRMFANQKVFRGCLCIPTNSPIVRFFPSSKVR